MPMAYLAQKTTSDSSQASNNRKRRRNNDIPQDAVVISLENDDEKTSDSKEMEQLESDDYFVVLGLLRTATESDVKKAYRKLAIQWHPDKNRHHPKAEEYFKRIGEAYAILSDPEKRSRYELYGREEHGGATPEYEHYSYDPFGSHAEFTARNARDLFEAFFGGMDPFEEMMFGGSSRSRSSRRRQTNDPFDDPFMGFGNVGMPMMMGFGSRRGGSMMESMFSDFGSFGNGISQSISTSSFTDQNGQTVTRKTTTSVRADGTRETTTEEFHNGRLVNESSSSSNRLAGAGRMHLEANAYESNTPHRKTSAKRHSHSRRY